MPDRSEVPEWRQRVRKRPANASRRVVREVRFGGGGRPPHGTVGLAVGVVVLLVAGLATYFLTRPNTHPKPPQGVQMFNNLTPIT